MPTVEEIKVVGLSLVTSGLVGAAILWLGKNWISERIKNAIRHEYDSKLETHKAQLHAENSILLERLKSQLNERHVQFSAVFAKREEILRELHREITVAVEACLGAARVGHEAEIPDAHEKMRRLISQMERVAIYFPEDFCEQWHKCVIDVCASLSGLEPARQQTRNSGEDRQRLKESFDTHWAALNEIRVRLRRESRKILGTEA